MTELLVVGFQDNIYRATGVLDELRVLDDTWILALADAVALHRDIHGVVAMDQNYQPTRNRSVEWGRTLGFLIGASLSVSFLADASPMVAEGTSAADSLGRIGAAEKRGSFWKERFGIPEEFLAKASLIVQPGNSAVYAIVEGPDSALAAARFQRYGGIILHLTLTTPQLQMIERIF